MAEYILDSNFFIQSHRFSNPLDISISFWKKVEQIAHDGLIISIDKVRDEIYRNEDELTDWCKNHLPADFFKDSVSLVDEYSRVAAWAGGHTQYNTSAKATFLDANIADAFLVTYALADIENRVIVTQEESAPNSIKRILLPEPCAYFSIRYINMIELFRELKVTF
jgi:hypothetical protein